MALGGISAGTAFVDVVPNMKDFASKVGAGVKANQQKLAQTAGRAGLVLTAGLVIGAKKAIGSASDLNETIAKTDAIFGKSADSIHAWAADGANSMGLSQNAAESAASSFQDMFLKIGVGNKVGTDMSKTLVGLSSDIASFSNASAPEVQEAMLSAFRGEYDALQKYVPAINAAKVETEALSATHKKSAKDLTDAEKAQAVYTLTMEQTTSAQGDFNKTRDSAANQERIAAANAENLSAQLGKGLLPAYQGVLKVLIAVTDFFSKHTTILKVVIAAIGTITAAMILFSTWMKIATVVEALFGKTAAAAWVAALGPVALIIAAIALLAIGFVILWKKSETFRRIVTGALNAVKAVALAVFNFIKSHWELLAIILLGPVGAIAVLIAHFGQIKDAVSGVYQWVKDKFNAMVSWLSGLPGRVSSAVGGLFDGIASAFKSAINTAIGYWNSFTSHLNIHINPPGPGSFDLDIGSSLQIPYLASGGYLRPGQVGIVGEKGAEFAVGGRHGTSIIPGAGGAGGAWELTITNWETGQAMIRQVANSEVEGAQSYDRQRARMRR